MPPPLAVKVAESPGPATVLFPPVPPSVCLAEVLSAPFREPPPPPTTMVKLSPEVTAKLFFLQYPAPAPEVL